MTRVAGAIALLLAACTQAAQSDGAWQPSLTLSADTSWKYAERASADFDNDGRSETAVLISNVTLDAKGHPLWEDGHRWRLYFEEEDGTRTYAFDSFVPNGRVDAIVPAPADTSSKTTPQQVGDRPVVTLFMQADMSYIALYEVAYGGPNRMRVRKIYERAIDKYLLGTPRI